MSLDPLKSPSLSQTDASRIGAGTCPRRAEAAGGETPADPQGPAPDRVHLSAASRTLL